MTLVTSTKKKQQVYLFDKRRKRPKPFSVAAWRAEKVIRERDIKLALALEREVRRNGRHAAVAALRGNVALADKLRERQKLHWAEYRAFRRRIGLNCKNVPIDPPAENRKVAA